MPTYVEIEKGLDEMFPDAKCEINHQNAFQLLVGVILSAQCTDKRVNMITPALFEKFPEAEDFARLTPEELEPYIYSAGFYKNKSKSIVAAAKSIVENYGGNVPETVDELKKLPGGGQKTANVVYSVAFGGNAIAVDTHVFRVTRRLGIANGKTPEKTELQLREFFPEKDWGKIHHQLIFLGRYRCKSQKPDCENCALSGVCKYYEENKR